MDDIGGEAGDALYRCSLAHSMADVQDNVHDELLWDLRALAAADLITDNRAARVGITSPVSRFYPSLHLNLAECYRKLGDLDQARQHLERGQAAVGDRRSVRLRVAAGPRRALTLAAARGVGGVQLLAKERDRR